MLYFTKRGMKLYGERIRQLRDDLREEMAKTANVCEVGGDDWHDNFSFDENQRQIERLSRMISEAEKVLVGAKLVELPENPTKIGLGCKAQMIVNGQNKTWYILGHGESDPKSNIMAYNAPFALEITGMTTDSEKTFQIGSNAFHVQILSIEPVTEE